MVESANAPFQNLERFLVKQVPSGTVASILEGLKGFYKIQLDPILWDGKEVNIGLSASTSRGLGLVPVGDPLPPIRIWFSVLWPA